MQGFQCFLIHAMMEIARLNAESSVGGFSHMEQNDFPLGLAMPFARSPKPNHGKFGKIRGH
jgi:hypothetical protein